MQKKHLNSFLWIFMILLLGASFLTHVSSYFNTKEINFATTKCYENDGEVILKIYNNLTKEYYFECKKK